MRLWSKIAMVAALTLASLIPLAMIHDVIQERARYRDEAVADIARSVGGAQQVGGPVLIVPYSELVDETYTDKDTGDIRTVRKRVEREQRVFAERLRVDGKLMPQTRKRGLHAVRTYEWSGTLDAAFALDVPAADASQRRYGTPLLAWTISDVRGLRGTPQLRIDGKPWALAQGSAVAERSGVHALLTVPQPGQRWQIDTRLAMTLAGTETFAVVPLARSNDIHLVSAWPHPKFEGLAARHRIDGNGFDARWQIDALATDAQQRWPQDASAAVAQAARGRADAVAALPMAADLAQVSLIDPVNPYTQASRATKYGVLFVLLTFAGFFLFELLRQVRVHPIQYALVGLALAIFFLLLVSLSEHIAFGAAYLAASGACIGLIVFYLSAVLRSAGAALGFGGMLLALYGVLYGLLLSEDNALVLGSALLFVILAGIMVATRKLDWYALGGPAWTPFRRDPPPAPSHAA